MTQQEPRPDWQRFAGCHPSRRGDVPVDVWTARFFPERGARLPTEVCAACVVRRECLTASLMSGEKVGLWGGLSEAKRRNLRRRAQTEPVEAIVTDALRIRPRR